MWLQLVWSNSARDFVWEVAGKSRVQGGLAVALCVEDDLWDLSILHGGAVVVPSRVTEGEAGFGSCCG